MVNLDQIKQHYNSIPTPEEKCKFYLSMCRIVLDKSISASEIEEDILIGKFLDSILHKLSFIS